MKNILFLLLLFLPFFGKSQLCNLDSVTNVHYTSVGYTTATLTGTPGDVVNVTWAVKYVRSGQTDTATTSYTASITKNLTGLQSGTLYKYYYITFCPLSGESSPNLSYYSFTTTSSAVAYTPMTAAGYQFKYQKSDSGMAMPFRDTSIGRGTIRPGPMVLNSQDSLPYFYNGVYWKPFFLDSAGFQAQINLKVDSVTVAGDSLFYWVNGTGYGQVITGLSASTMQEVFNTESGTAVLTQNNTMNGLGYDLHIISDTIQFTGDVYLNDGFTYAHGSPGVGKVLTSDANGLGSWETGTTPTWQQTLTAGNTLDAIEQTIFGGNGATSNLIWEQFNEFRVLANVGANSLVQFKSTNGTISSELNIIPESIQIEPYIGNLHIDTLLNKTTQNQLMGWTSSGADRGGVGYVTIGTGLSLAGGVLSSTGVASSMPINGLTGASGSNSIDNGNTLQSWAWNSHTGVFPGLLISSSSTAMGGTGAPLLSVSVSGANASSTKTGTAANFSSTRTGTSSTNNGLIVAASGATTNNAIVISAGALSLNGDAGTAGYVLTSGGANTIPTWSASGANLTATYMGYGSAGNALTGSENNTWTAATNMQTIDSGVIKLTGSATYGDAGVGSIFKSSSYGLTMRAVSGASYDWLVFGTSGNSILANEAGTDNFATSAKFGAGLLGYSLTAIMDIAASTTSNSSLRIRDGVAPTSPNAGDIWKVTDKFYGVINTGTATKEFTLNDIALTSGRVPYNTTNGRLTDVSTFTFGSGLLSVPQIKGSGSAPGIAGGTGAGTTPTVSITGTDLAGLITVTTDADPIASGVFCTVTFATAFSSAPYVIITPANSNAADDINTGAVLYTNSTTTTFTINTNTVKSPAALTEIKYYYQVIQ